MQSNTINVTGERRSEYELIRIVATFFVLFYHCNGWFLSHWGGVDGWRSLDSVTNLWRIAVNSVTCIGVDLFVLISGYFGIRPKFSSIFNLFSILFFFYISFFLIDCLLANQIFTWKKFIGSCLVFSRDNWFIQSYLVLYLFSPLLNQYMDGQSERRALVFVSICLAFAFWFGCVRECQYVGFNDGYSPLSLIIVYLVGRYLSLYGMNRLSHISTILIAVIYISLTFVIGMILYYQSPRFSRLLIYCSPLVILPAVALFCFISRFPLQRKFINWLGVSCLAVFISHCFSPVIELFAKSDVFLFQSQPLHLWIIYMFGICVIIFFSAIFLDKVRLLLFSPVLRYIRKFDYLIVSRQ